MNTKTDATVPAVHPPAAQLPIARKPRFAFLIATACGLGYLPKAPGTWGSLGGAFLAIFMVWITSGRTFRAVVTDLPPGNFWTIGWIPGYGLYVIAILVAVLGVWAASRAARHAGQKDPQFIVIDEVSGQLITYFMPFAVLNWEILVARFYTFSSFRHLEAFSRAASGVFARRVGYHGR